SAPTISRRHPRCPAVGYTAPQVRGGHAIFKGETSSNLPSSARLEAVALHLAGQGDHRSLITLVETWAEQAQPTVAVRLAEARSFVSLRMVDRAWVRLKDLVECPEPHVEALQIAAQMFLLRGWQNQARKVVQMGLERAPEDPLLEALKLQAEEPPPPIDDVIDENALSAELVRVAEQYMARGAFVRARTLLERVRRREPGHARMGELLWAIRGEFTTTESLGSMCERWAPAAPSEAGTEVGEGETVRLDGRDARDGLDGLDGFDEPEHTVTARVDDLRPAADDRSFPQLFRHLDEGREGETTEETTHAPTREVTAVRALADANELDVDASSFPERTDHGEDTQIARVMRKGGILQPIDSMHTGSHSVDTSFDLARFRREMGVDRSSDLLGPEDEDDSVVFRTGAEAATPTGEAGHDLSLDTRDERLAKARQGSAEEAWAAPAGPPPNPRILGRPKPKSTPSKPSKPSKPLEPGTAARAADEEPTKRMPDPRSLEQTRALPDPPAAKKTSEPPPAAPRAPEPLPDEDDRPTYVGDPSAAEPSDYDPYWDAAAPVPWPYYFFGLAAVLAFLMMVFFVVVVASALL
ncbi:MAG: hypothetical protein R3F59_38250, partial [Myxococcota bacterium]